MMHSDSVSMASLSLIDLSNVRTSSFVDELLSSPSDATSALNCSIPKAGEDVDGGCGDEVMVKVR